MNTGSGGVGIVGVHGIFQARKNATSLAAEWSRAIRRGLIDAAFDVPALILQVPHLSPLLRVPTNLLGADDDEALASLTDDERVFIESSLEDALADLDRSDVERLAEEAATLAGLPAFPTRRGLTLLAAVDGRWRGGARLVLALLREVFAYLHAPTCGWQVRRRVRLTATSQTRMLLAHSLGSVIAFDLLRRGELPQVTTLVTFGSPLGWPTVRTALANCAESASPSELVTWTNIYDHRDAVTAGRRLAGFWPQVTDVEVSNPVTDAHGAQGYLRQPIMAALIAGDLR